MDLDHLYKSLHEVVGDEDEFIDLSSARLRVLGVCYDLRHALMGDREIKFVDNGMDREKMKGLSVMTPEKNVYYKVNVLWPEILFVTMVLNQFARRYAYKKTKKNFDAFTSKEIIWDDSLACVRIFQSTIASCLKAIVTPASYNRIMTIMKNDYTSFTSYTWQYLDVLNCKFIAMNTEKRVKQLSVMVKRMTEYGDEYKRIKRQVHAAAKEFGTHVDHIQAPVEYPETIDW